jgi:hypothetical protein
MLALLAALAGQPTPGPAPEPPSGPASLVVVGNWRGYRIVGPACAPGEVCMDIDVDARLRGVRTLSGPRVRSGFTARLRIHAPPAAGFRPILLVWPGAPDTPWRARWVTIAPGASGGHTPVCIDLAILRAARVSPPPRGRSYDNQVCVPV